MLIARKGIEEALSTISTLPGCYLYRNREGRVIYVGKAKNLRRRISSYFNREHEDRKTRALLRDFQTVEYIVVKSEHDALLLENNLIKQYDPIYNVLLKQGDTYPYVCIKNELFPRVFVTHKLVRDGSQYFGPYPTGGMAWTLVNLFKQLYKFRTCSLVLTEEGVSSGRFKPCLKYHIDRCYAPCIGVQTVEEYDANINDAKRVLSGQVRALIEDLEERREYASTLLDFEAANGFNRIINQLKNYQAKSVICSEVIADALVVSSASDADAFYVNYLEIHDGNIVSGRTMEYKKGIEQDESEFFSFAILELLSIVRQDIKELILPYQPDYNDFPGYTITIPQRGDRRKVLDLSIQNVKQYMKDKYAQTEKLNPQQRSTQVLRELQSALGLPSLPYHVEAFDNSNISGAHPVSACIVFKGAKPSKQDYRHYHIRDTQGPDDYASMYEVVLRRYGKLKESGGELPDLIVTDGGKGHMNIVRQALSELGLDISVLGLAKDTKHNTSQVLFGDPPQVVGIVQRSPVFHLLERIQNEVHRFAITFHRKLRSKAQTKSILDEIDGIGPVYKKKLLCKFGSVKRIKASSESELQAAIGQVKGSQVFNFFKKQG